MTAECTNLAGEILEARKEVLAALQGEIDRERLAAQRHLRDAIELAGPDSGFAKYQRGVLHAVAQLEKALRGMA